ncbi:uncharacterized protein LAESUDRAFT_493274 [Laetiporus sulphureus 93-53]|uniref:Uncharacterized protein n=1 Tax=Laetiporus sulphureus 93-53 TaxID=1314785 RepID=A0A165BJ71_9APHY|nr:uncharacterized protein LAESUDRAFT_493274 [Laetiporus sulphureus 93-53]KZT01159.1 hypothetical protein LAESUDRAFT_493274 [Laetiporus sulphureus 93-53]
MASAAVLPRLKASRRWIRAAPSMPAGKALPVDLVSISEVPVRAHPTSVYSRYVFADRFNGITQSLRIFILRRPARAITCRFPSFLATMPSPLCSLIQSLGPKLPNCGAALTTFPASARRRPSRIVVFPTYSEFMRASLYYVSRQTRHFAATDFDHPHRRILLLYGTTCVHRCLLR